MVIIRPTRFYILEQFENPGYIKLQCDCTAHSVLIYVLYTVQDMRAAFVNGKAALLRNVSCYVRQSTEQICASALHCFLFCPQIRAVKPSHTM